MARWTSGILTAMMLLACGPRASAPEVRRAGLPTFSRDTSFWAETAASGVQNEDLAELLFQHWEWQMREAPEWATRLGDRRFDDRVYDATKEARDRRSAQTERFVIEARRIGEQPTLSESDAVTLAMFIDRLVAGLASDVCRFPEWNLSARDNPITRWNHLPTAHRVESERDARNLVARYRQIPTALGTEVANLRSGAADGWFANAETTRRVIAMVEEQLAEPTEEWTLYDPVGNDHPNLSDEFLSSYRRELAAILRSEIQPALQRYRDSLVEEILPHARSEQETGLGALADGAACYDSQIRYHTGLSATAEELHHLGLVEIARITEEMKELGQRILGTDDLPEILSRLRSDPALYFETAEEIEQKAARALAAAAERMPEWFGIRPETPCVVVRVPDYEAPFTTIAYYRQPSADGSKPGEYFVNVLDPHTRPRFEAEVLAYHEAIPGHHLQIAIAQELEALPAFRRFTGINAYIEGWALYTERLADEMGLYTADLDRMGMRSYDAWRASRLVVDTGIHAMGWSREQAVQYMLEHTALAENNIRNEVDRYISWPGQALSYKVGQLEILSLRRRAEEQLGERFDIRAFHDVILGGGAVTLPVLRGRVEAWIEGQ